MEKVITTKKILRQRVETVELASLNVGDYQREAKRAHIASMIADPNMDAVGVLFIGEREDLSKWVIDGLQRSTMLVNLGYTHAKAIVVKSRGPEHEAHLFRVLNSHRVRITKIDTFWAAYFADDTHTVQLYEAIQEAGLDIPRVAQSGTPWPHIGCIGTLETVYQRGGKEHVQEVLGIITSVWAEFDEALRNEIIDGLSRLLRACPDICRDRLVEKLSAVHPRRVLVLSSTFRSSNSQTNRGASACLAMLKLYNQNRRKNAMKMGEEQPARYPQAFRRRKGDTALVKLPQNATLESRLKQKKFVFDDRASVGN